MTLEQIVRFIIPAATVSSTECHLRDGGRDGYERFVLWTGVVQEATVFRVITTHLPNQTGFKLSSGLCVRVDGDELHRLNQWLFESGETLAVQIHSHPTTAYHSATDDAYPIATQLGAVSIVVPDFCRRGMFVSGSAIYRLDREGWSQVHPSAAATLLRIEE